jgi:acetyl-CoA acetyltransferase
MSVAASQQAVIVGIGETRYFKRGGATGDTELSLAVQAIRASAADAGLDAHAIDGLVSYDNDMCGTAAYGAALLQVSLGLPVLRHAAFVWCSGGGGGAAAVSIAASAVETGRARYVCAFRAIRQTEDVRYGQYNPERPFYNWNAPFDLYAPAPMFAMHMQRYMHVYGATSNHLAEVALSARANANRNPRALFYRQPMTEADYLASRMIADPYRLFDCCLESDGAAAVLVTTVERARDLPGRAVPIVAATQGSDLGWGGGVLSGFNMPERTFTTGNLTGLAHDLFDAAQLTPADIDVAQIYDAFTGNVLITLEDYGFCGRGEAGAFVASGALRWPDGALPINTAGGLLSEAYIHGFNLITEGVRQMRGESTSQVEDAEFCLVASSQALSPSSGLILGRA